MVQTFPFQDRRPLYQVVAERLITAIQRGEYPVGSELPSEALLCEQFSVSRNTVREAVRLLEQAGMVSRRQGVGTRVERDGVHQQYAQTLATISDLWQYVKDTRRKILSIESVRAADAGVSLPGESGAAWRRVEALRYVQDETRPIAWTQVLLPAAYGAVLDELDADDELICSRVEARFGISTYAVEQEISAVEIPKNVAALLNVRPKSPGLAMLRRYFDDQGAIYEVTWSIHPTERYKYAMKIIRSFTALGKT